MTLIKHEVRPMAPAKPVYILGYGTDVDGILDVTFSNGMHIKVEHDGTTAVTRKGKQPTVTIPFFGTMKIRFK